MAPWILTSALKGPQPTFAVASRLASMLLSSLWDSEDFTSMSKTTSTVLTINAGTLTTARNGTDSTTFWTCVSPPASEPPLRVATFDVVPPCVTAICRVLADAPVPGDAVMVTADPLTGAGYFGDEERR